MITVSQVLVAVAVTCRVRAARDRRREERCVREDLQTDPRRDADHAGVRLPDPGPAPVLRTRAGRWHHRAHALPVGIRLTNLGICRCRRRSVEAGVAFGLTSRQLLGKAPTASILLGVNQTIMMVLSGIIAASSAARGRARGGASAGRYRTSVVAGVSTPLARPSSFYSYNSGDGSRSRTMARSRTPTPAHDASSDLPLSQRLRHLEPEPRAADEAGDDHYRQDHHDRLVHPEQDRRLRQGKLDLTQKLPRGRPEGQRPLRPSRAPAGFQGQ